MTQSTPPGFTDDDVRLVTEATEQHHIVFDHTDANGNSPCVCDGWWDTDQGPGWDEHLAEVTLSVLVANGWTRPEVSR